MNENQTYLKYARVYKLVSPQTTKVYVGSTVQPCLSTRKAVHKCHFKTYKNGGGQKLSAFEVSQYDDFDIVQIRQYKSCKTRAELTKHERHWMNHYGTDCCNAYVPGRSQKEWAKTRSASR